MTRITPVAGPAHPLVGPAATLPPLPICEHCGRTPYGCVCNVEEPDVMPVEDMKRVMPELFERSSFGMLPSGWERIEL